MANAEQHAAAIAALDQTEVGGRTIYVSESLPKEKVAENKQKYNTEKQSKSLMNFQYLEALPINI